MLRLALALVLTTTATASARAEPSARCDGAVAQDRITRIDQHGDVLVGEGQLLTLADIRLFDGASARLATLAGEGVTLQLAGSHDRWGRMPARIVLARDGRDLAALLLGEGLALVDVGTADGLCRPALLAEESGARRAGRGIWASGLLRASEPQAIGARAGQFTVVEGRIVSVGERSRWTYLNFGRDFSRDFAVSISRRNWDVMKRQGLSAEALRGRMVRVRGIVEMRRAPGIEVTSAQMIELVGTRRPSPDTPEP